MKAWWLRPSVRLLAALLLPFVVPAVITLLIWALPGDPAEIICPPERCGGTQMLAERWNLDQGPWHFFVTWMGAAFEGDFGRSWRVQQGEDVGVLLREAVPTSATLLLLTLIPMLSAAAAAAVGWLPARIDNLLSGIGTIPAVIFSLLFAAVVEINYGADSFGEEGTALRMLFGVIVLCLADGALAGAVTGVRALFAAERSQRYVGVALLRGERPLSNMLPNVAPALIGQLRARVLHLLSGAVVVEVVLRINGIGDLLWLGTLMQDFGVVLAAATVFASFSAVLLAIQAIAEIIVALHVRRAPALAAPVTA
ncbi:MAG TPA: ABC transporter permease subunit [Myxococcota bacterium]|nr:ABC transporter permease subunit [Myxococcota bacterium]